MTDQTNIVKRSGGINNPLGFLEAWYNNLLLDESLVNGDTSPRLPELQSEYGQMVITVMLMQVGETVEGRAYQITRTSEDEYMVTADTKAQR